MLLIGKGDMVVRIVLTERKGYWQQILVRLSAHKLRILGSTLGKFIVTIYIN